MKRLKVKEKASVLVCIDFSAPLRIFTYHFLHVQIIIIIRGDMTHTPKNDRICVAALGANANGPFSKQRHVLKHLKFLSEMKNRIHT